MGIPEIKKFVNSNPKVPLNKLINFKKSKKFSVTHDGATAWQYTLVDIQNHGGYLKSLYLGEIVGPASQATLNVQIEADGERILNTTLNFTNNATGSTSHCISIRLGTMDNLQYIGNSALSDDNIYPLFIVPANFYSNKEYYWQFMTFYNRRDFYMEEFDVNAYSAVNRTFGSSSNSSAGDAILIMPAYYRFNKSLRITVNASGAPATSSNSNATCVVLLDE